VIATIITACGHVPDGAETPAEGLLRHGESVRWWCSASSSFGPASDEDIKKPGAGTPGENHLHFDGGGGIVPFLSNVV
jgi:hypothetical protein